MLSWDELRHLSSGMSPDSPGIIESELSATLERTSLQIGAPLDLRAIGSHPPGYANTPTVAALHVTVQQKIAGLTVEIPYSMCSMNMPLTAVVKMFLADCHEQPGQRRYWRHHQDAELLSQIPDTLCLWHCGRKVDLRGGATPSSVGMGPHQVNACEIREDESKRFSAEMNCLNRLGAALMIRRPGELQAFNDADCMGQVFALLDVPELLRCSGTCVHWHLVSQRYSLLVQLQCGSFSALSNLHFPSWLALIQEYSHVITPSAISDAAKRQAQWEALGQTKALTGRHFKRSVPLFCKAAGCTTMMTINADCSEKSLALISDAIGTAKTHFLTKPAGFTAAGDILSREEVCTLVQAGEMSGEMSRQQPAHGGDYEEQLVPPAAGVFVAPAVDSTQLNMSVDLFRQNFSPECFFLFPLIAHQQRLSNIDFTDTQTWTVFHDGVAAGSVAWRFRRATFQASTEWDKIHGELTGAKDCLEVLFICVWEQHRQKDLGSYLVAALEDEARRGAAHYLYVEIGHEQPKAKTFWARNGFGEVTAASLPQLQFFENQCLRFKDTAQWSKHVA